MKKTLIATATAGLIAAGAMVGITSTASAASFQFGGPGWSFGMSDGYHSRHHMRECRPIIKTVSWRDYRGYPHYKKVVVGQNCGWGGGYGGQGGWGGGPGPWQGPNSGWGYHPY
jgi:hypothetical protein